MSYFLVIDDNKQTTDVMIQMLKLLKYEARSALGPSAAMAILNAGDPPALIFLDINMPGVNGFEVLAYIKREPRLEKVPVIIVTSDDQPQIHDRAKAGGAEAVMIKPVLLDNLEKTLRRVGIPRGF